jgi:hypothetical protein
VARPQSPNENHLVASLPVSEAETLYPHLERVPLALGQVLYESGAELQHVYFPTDSIVSLLYVMENGASVSRCLRKNVTERVRCLT